MGELRKSGLNFTAYGQALSSGGASSDIIANLRSFDYDPDIDIQDAKAINAVMDRGVPVGILSKFTAEHYVDNSGRQSSLNISTFSIGGTSYLGEFKRGSLKITNPFKNLKGGAELQGYPQFCGGRKIEISGDFMIDAANATAAKNSASWAETVAEMTTGNLGNLVVAASVVFGPHTYTSSKMLIAEAGHVVETEDGQMQKLRLVSQITQSSEITSPTGSSTMFALATAYANTEPICYLKVNTGANLYGGTSGVGTDAFPAYIESAEYNFDEGSILQEKYGLIARGVLAVTQP